MLIENLGSKLHFAINQWQLAGQPDIKMDSGSEHLSDMDYWMQMSWLNVDSINYPVYIVAEP